MAFLARRHYRSSLMRRERILRDRNNPLDYDDDDRLILNYRLPRTLILYLIDIFQDEVQPQTNRNHEIHPSLQVMIALRFLATGSLYSTIADSAGVSRSSVCRIVKRFCGALSSRISDFIYIDMNSLNKTATDFFAITDFPNVLGRWLAVCD